MRAIQSIYWWSFDCNDIIKLLVQFIMKYNLMEFNGQ